MMQVHVLELLGLAKRHSSGSALEVGRITQVNWVTFCRVKWVEKNYLDVTRIDHERLIVLFLVEQLACTNEWHG